MPVSEEPSPDQAMYDTLDPTLTAPLAETERDGTSASSETPIPRFDDKYKDPLHGLLFIGALKKKFSWLGHEFVIKTLHNRDYGDVALCASPYRETEFFGKAYQTATVAACIISVDGQPLPTMPVLNTQTEIQAKFDYVMDRWHSPVIDYVFTQFWELESVVRELIDELGKPSG